MSGIAATRALAARFGSDIERMRHTASRFAARHFGVESACGLALVLSIIPGAEKLELSGKGKAVAGILRAKERGSETRYLRLMQGHARLRAALLKLGPLIYLTKSGLRPEVPLESVPDCGGFVGGCDRFDKGPSRG